MAVCDVCFRHCKIEEGGTGFCGARTFAGGKIIPANYGRVTSLALDPIEKKPLRRFCPGSMILSVGSYGCNLRCPFCQNSEISWSDEALAMPGQCDGPEAGISGQCGGHESGTSGHKAYGAGLRTEYVTPEDLANTAEYYRKDGNIGVAFTYNEPLIGYEYVRDAAKLVREMGMKNVVVTNGTAELDVLRELAPYIDAMNIDLKGFTDRYYSKVLGGSLEMVMDFIRDAVKVCHVELTTLIVPGENDLIEEIEEMCDWIAGLDVDPKYYGGSVGLDDHAKANGVDGDHDYGEGASGADIPLHVTRFFPCFHMTDRGPTDVDKVFTLAEAARGKLKYVYEGNV